METDRELFWRTVPVMTVAGLVIVGQLYAVIPLVGDLVRDWHVSVGAATATTSLFGVPYSVGFLLTGPLADRFGRRRVVAVGLTVLTLATLALGWSGSMAVGGPLRVLQGLGAAAFSPAALAYLAERIEPRRRPVAIASLVTSFLAAVVVGQLLAQAFAALGGWRTVFWGNAVLLAVITVALYRVMLPDGPGASTLRDTVRAMGALAVRPSLTLLYVATLPVLGGFVGVYTALQLLPPATLGGTPAQLFLLRLSALPAMIAIPFVAGRLSRIPTIRRTAFALAAACVLLVAVALTADTNVVVLGALLFVYVAAVATISPGLTELVGSMSGTARAAGIAIYTFALLMGASLGPPVVTALRPYGLTVVLCVLAATQAVAAVVVWSSTRVAQAQTATPTST